MSAPKGNQFAAKPAANKRLASAIYIRPTIAERREIMRWVGSGKVAAKCLAAILAAARSDRDDKRADSEK